MAVLLGFLAALAVLRAGPVLAASPDACGSLQALVDGAADGATVTVPPCVYRETVAITRPVTLDGTGSVIDGDGVRPYWVTVRADDVTLIGFTMRNAAPADPQAGSLDVQDVERFTGRDLQLTGGSYAGVRLWFTRDARLEDVDVSGSRGLGVIGWEAHRTSVVGGHVNANDTAGYDSEYEAGGLKFGKSDDVTIEDVEVDHNVGPGVWCDVECHRFTVRDSRIHHNDRMGVLFEISTDATIEDNQIWENGWGDPAWGWGGGVVISSSGGATVRDNLVAWNADGVVVVSQDRADRAPVTDNVLVGNTVALAAQPGDGHRYAVGWLEDWGSGFRDASADNAGSDQQVWSSAADSDRVLFAWGDILPLTTFTTTPGGERTTRLERDELLTRLAAAGIPAGAAAHQVTNGLTGRELVLELAPYAIATGVAVVILVVVGGFLVWRRRRSFRETAVNPPAE